MQTRSRLVLAPLVVIAGFAWAVAWGFNGQVSDGTLRVLGLTEGSWRAMLNPALVVVLAAATAWAASRPRSIGALLAVAGIGAMAAGNVLEFGLLGAPTPAAAIGSTVFMAGAAVAVAGLALQIGQAAAKMSGRVWLGGTAGIATALVVAVVSLAAPPAAALALFPLVDALTQGPPRESSVAPVGSLRTSEAQG